jgi:N-acetylglutamate synthase-like GNAT family acetyltransferase
MSIEINAKDIGKITDAIRKSGEALRAKAQERGDVTPFSIIEQAANEAGCVPLPPRPILRRE